VNSVISAVIAIVGRHKSPEPKIAWAVSWAGGTKDERTGNPCVGGHMRHVEPEKNRAGGQYVESRGGAVV